MTKQQPALSIARMTPLIKLLCRIWLCAGLAAAPNIAGAAKAIEPTAADSHVTPWPGCGLGQRGTGEAGGKVEAQELRGRTASPVTAKIGERTCRLIAAAEASIRNNPAIF
jgi:hypothetical protein